MGTIAEGPLTGGATGSDERVVLCAEDGTALGTAAKSGVHHRTTPLHLAFSCYVFDDDGRVLVSRRARTKATFPGVRTNTCCGHPAPGEDLLAAVRRRLRYELGIVVGAIDLVLPQFRYRAVAADGTVENELCPVLRARAVDTRVEPDPAEVDAAWWMPWPDFVARVRDADRLSSWAAEQVDHLVRLGPDPWAWPVGNPALLPAAAVLTR